MANEYTQYPNAGNPNGNDRNGNTPNTGNGAPESFGPAFGPYEGAASQPTRVNGGAQADHFAQAGAQSGYQAAGDTYQYPAQAGYAQGYRQQAQGQQRYGQGYAQAQPQAQTQAPYAYQQAQQRQAYQGYAYQQAQTQSAQQAQASQNEQENRSQGPQLQREHGLENVRVVPDRKQHVGLKAVACGLLGGVLGSAGVVWALSATGNLGKTTVVTQESAAGQAVSIAANSEDVTIAEAVAAKALPSVCSVYVTTGSGAGMGSGVILDTDGNILTNYHVAGDAETISVTIGGKSYDATLVGGDASSDLAVVHADLGGDVVTPMEIGNSDDLVVGDWVMTIGSPFGLDQSVSAGVVSSLARNELMQSTYGTTVYANLIQTDASINPGNSGGALVNEQGQLVGISTLFSSDTESFAGIGFAIPGNYAVDIANKIISGDQVTHAYIGLSMQTVNAQNAAANKLSVNQGAYVAQVAEGSPADEAGIKEGDILIRLGGTEITSADGAILAVRSHAIGETVQATVMRGNEELNFDVTLTSDERLQDLQRQMQEQQQQQQQQFQQFDLNGNGYGNGGNGGNGMSDEDIYEYLYDYLYNNNRGGSYNIAQ